MTLTPYLEWALTPLVKAWINFPKDNPFYWKGLRNAELQLHFLRTGEVLDTCPAPLRYRELVKE